MLRLAPIRSSQLASISTGLHDCTRALGRSTGHATTRDVRPAEHYFGAQRCGLGRAHAQPGLQTARLPRLENDAIAAYAELMDTDTEHQAERNTLRHLETARTLRDELAE